MSYVCIVPDFTDSFRIQRTVFFTLGVFWAVSGTKHAGLSAYSCSMVVNLIFAMQDYGEVMLYFLRYLYVNGESDKLTNIRLRNFRPSVNALFKKRYQNLAIS